MAKLGEINYLRNLGDYVLRHAGKKPFCDDDCPKYLTLIGTVMSLLPPPPARLLDLGCGPGWTSVFFAKRGYEVVGVDIAADMIALANQARERECLENLHFVEADYEDLTFQNEFDCVVFYDSLHHAVDEETALRRACQALKPEGMLVTSEPGEGHQDSPGALEARKYDITEKDMPPDKIIGMARRLGFGQFRVFPHSYDLLHLFEHVFYSHQKPARPEHRLENAGFWKRLFHGLLRKRLGIGAQDYATLMNELPWFLFLSHNKPVLDKQLSIIRRSSGIVAMVKEGPAAVRAS